MKKWIAWVVLTVMLFAAGCAFADGGKLPIDLSPGAAWKAEYEPGDYQLYEDPTIRVEKHRFVSPYDEFGCTVYYSLITIGDASQLRTYPADGSSFCAGTRMPCGNLARRTRAVLAINGDYPATFTGNAAVSYVLRQGKVYRDSVAEGLDILLIDEDGDFHVLRRDEDLAGTDKTQIDGKKVVNAFQFGPALIIDGEPVDDETLLDRNHSPMYAEPDDINQRMVICQIDTLQYMVVCVAHHGATLPTMRDIALHIAPSCKVAYVLDGGESTQMVFLNVLCNNTEGTKESRELADIIYFASANN